MVGVIKIIDSAGRLIIPSDIRSRLGLFGEVELVMTDEGLLVRKYYESLGKSDKTQNFPHVLTKCSDDDIIMK